VPSCSSTAGSSRTASGTTSSSGSPSGTASSPSTCLREREFLADSLLEAYPEHVDWLLHIALQTPLDVSLRVVREQARVDQRGIVERLRIPVLAAWSRHDPYWPVALADWIAEHARHGERVLFERSAHCIPFEESERFCAVLERFATGAPARLTAVPAQREET
jgi:pimeloyl-ACP methyl ester carboxylesterase